MSPSQNIPGSAGPDGSELLLRRPHAVNCLLGFVVLPLGSGPPFPETLVNESGNRAEVGGSARASGCCSENIKSFLKMLKKKNSVIRFTKLFWIP